MDGESPCLLNINHITSKHTLIFLIEINNSIDKKSFFMLESVKNIKGDDANAIHS